MRFPCLQILPGDITGYGAPRDVVSPGCGDITWPSIRVGLACAVHVEYQQGNFFAVCILRGAFGNDVINFSVNSPLSLMCLHPERQESQEDF